MEPPPSPDHRKTAAWQRFVDEADDRPLAALLSFIHPHTPYKVSEPWHSLYAERTPLGHARHEGDLRAAGKPFRQWFHQANNNALIPYNDADTQHLRQVYAGMVSCLDHEIGLVLKHLEASDRLDRTQIWFMADHGDYLGDHGLFTKNPALYDCLIRTPMIVSGPGITAQQHSNALVSHVDVLPTILASAGIDVPDQAQGVNLTPLLQGDSSLSPRPFAVAEYGIPGVPYDLERMTIENVPPGSQFRKPQNPVPWEGNPVSLAGRIRMIRTTEWKLVHEPGGTDELYNLIDDPHELTNLLNRPHSQTSHRIRATKMRKQLLAWATNCPGYDDEIAAGQVIASH